MMPHQQTEPYLIVLGFAQDAGFPHVGCRKECCLEAWNDASAKRMVTCLGLVDPLSQQRWVFEATPDFSHQLERLNEIAPTTRKQPGLDGIFLTHAHIGHYSGLIYLGREALGARDVPVFAMPRMRQYLRENGPWSQLLALENIQLSPIEHASPIKLNDRLSVTPMLVPHRDEFSETVGFEIHGPNHKVLFLPDIDKWDRWETKIEHVIARVDHALVDGTFFDDAELPGRDMSEIPHPFVTESITRFEKSLSAQERRRIRFIHFNHTNRALQKSSQAFKTIHDSGMRVAQQGETIPL